MRIVLLLGQVRWLLRSFLWLLAAVTSVGDQLQFVPLDLHTDWHWVFVCNDFDAMKTLLGTLLS